MIEALTDLRIVPRRIIQHPNDTIIIKDVEALGAENDRLRVR